MYVEENGCYVPNTMQEDGLGVPEDGFSQSMNPNFSMEELSAYHHHHHHQEEEEENGGATKAEMEMQQQMGLDMNHMMQEGIHDPNHGGLGLAYDQSNWENQEFQQHLEMQNGHHHHHHHHQQQNFNNPSLQEPPYPPTPDLLNLLHLPRCSLPNSTLSFMNPNGNFQSSLGGYIGEIPTMESVAATSSVMYDPLFHLNLPPQPPVFRDLFQSLPHGYSLPGSRTGSLFSGVDEREVSTGGGVYQDGEGTRNFDNGIFEFNREIKCIPKGKNGKGGTKHFATERERRENLNDKYRALRDLVPSPTKQDRASVVGDAIGYIEELKRTVNELTLLVEKKRCARERSKRQRTEDSGAATGEAESCNIKAEPDQSYNGSSSLRSSWLQRKSKGTEVDVRIIDDEVTIKLAQRKKINCLLIVSRLLDEFQLEIHHVAGGLVGDNYSFLFNSKICEGSSVYASAIASKLIEVVDRQYAVTPPTNSY